jgi:hypothetical protein
VHKFLDTAVKTSNVLICAANFAAGCLHFSHHQFVQGLLNFAVACFVAIMMYYLAVASKKHEQTMARLRRQLEELERREHMNDLEVAEAEAKALANLQQIAKVVGARVEGPNRAFLKVGKDEFQVDVGSVYRTRGLTGLRNCTCYQLNVRIPYAEMIASTLLLLKHDPKIFDRWVNRDGYCV